MRRLKICFVSTPWLSVGPKRGGIPKMILELSRALSREHEIHIVCPRPIPESEPHVEPGVQFHFAAARELLTYPIPEKVEPNLKGVRLLTQMFFGVAAIFATYAEVLRKHRFDVTYITNKYVAVPILLTLRGRRHGMFVYSEQNIWPWLYPTPPGGSALLRYLVNLWLGKLVCRLSDAVHANSNSLRETLLSLGVDGRRIAAIPNGVEVPPQDAEPEPLTEPLRVAFVGRLVEDKGVKILADAIRRVNAERKRVDFVIFGDGPMRSLLPENGAENCTVMGDRPREEVLAALRSIHITLFLSPVENIPSLALLEALALGKAVIATRVGDTPRFLSDGANAVLCEPNAVSVARAIAMVSGDRALYSTVTSGAQALAATYSWDEVAARHLAFYLSAIGAFEALPCISPS